MDDTYQKVTGPLMANSHPGSYSGQDAYNDMLITKVYGISPYHSNCMLSDNPHSGIYEAKTSRTLDALNCGYPGCNQGGMAVVSGAVAIGIDSDKNATVDGIGALTAHTSGGNQQSVMVSGGGMAMDCRNGTEDEVNGTLQAGGFRNLNSCNTVRNEMTVRRLTPLECERLQGLPDNWTLIGEPEEKEVIDYAYTYDEDGNEIGKEEIGRHTEIEYYYMDNGKRKKCSDSARYKALGNSIAIPPWKWVLKRLCAQYERDATMASLFDGLGAFPLIWEQLNGKGSCLWASEIEEFPMAVTKIRFGDG